MTKDFFDALPEAPPPEAHEPPAWSQPPPEQQSDTGCLGLVGDLTSQLPEALIGDGAVEPAAACTEPALLRGHAGDVEVLEHDCAWRRVRAGGCSGDDGLGHVMQVVGTLRTDPVMEHRDPPGRCALVRLADWATPLPGRVRRDTVRCARASCRSFAR